MSERLNVSQFAKLAGCDEKQVRRAIAKGLLTKGDDGLLGADLVASGWRKANRRTITKDSDKSSDTSKVSEKRKPKVVRPSVLDGESPDEAAKRILDSGDANLDLTEALRLKENYLALLRQLEYEQKSGSLIELTTAEAVLFDAFRGQRDAWLSWPTRVGPLLAAQLGIDEADRVTDFLTAHVHKQIATLGEPDAEFVDREN